MGERFSSLLGRQLFVWSGWVFTVGGAVGSFVQGHGYAWIGWLVVLTVLRALTGHSYVIYQQLQTTRAEHDRLAGQLRDAERKLNEIPLDLLNRIRELVTPQS